jgi:hypothetical protein
MLKPSQKSLSSLVFALSLSSCSQQPSSDGSDLALNSRSNAAPSSQTEQQDLERALDLIASYHKNLAATKTESAKVDELYQRSIKAIENIITNLRFIIPAYFTAAPQEAEILARVAQSQVDSLKFESTNLNIFEDVMGSDENKHELTQASQSLFATAMDIDKRLKLLKR